MAGKQKNKADHLPVGKFFAWKSRDVSLAAMNTIILGYLMIYCTNTLGMKAALVGTLLMASKIFDGITDLFAGYLVDNTHTKWGKARPYEFAILGVWLCTILLFSASPEWSNTLKAVWVFAMYTFVFSIFSTLLNANGTPYMIRAFSNNRAQITKCSSFGGIVSMLGGMVVSVSFPILMGKLATSASGWRTLILIYAIPMMLLGVCRFIFVKEDPKIDEGNPQRVSIKQVLTMLKKNKYCWIYAGIMGLYQLIVGLGAGTYYFTYIIGDISKFGIVSVLSVILLPVMLAFPTMMRKMSIGKLFAIFTGISIVGYAIVFFGDANFSIVLIGIILSTLLNLPLGYLGALVVMQLATFNEYNNLPRMEGSAGVVSGFASKVGGGLGTFLCGILLTASGFVSTTSSSTVAQPESAILMIRMLYSIIPLIGCVIILILSIMLSKLSKQMPMMEAAIQARIANETTETPAEPAAQN